jgi:hypothetical protein
VSVSRVDQKKEKCGVNGESFTSVACERVLDEAEEIETGKWLPRNLHLEDGVLILLVGLDLDSLELDNGLEVNLSLLLLYHQKTRQKSFTV